MGTRAGAHDGRLTVARGGYSQGVDDQRETSEARGRGGIQSLHRAFDILEFVARFDVVGATRISTDLGLSVSTVNNLCRTMADRGYLVGRRGQYRVGPAFTLLATRWNPMLALPEIVVPVLESLTEATGQAAVATVLTGMDARVVAFEQGRGPVGTPPPRSDRRALHSAHRDRARGALSENRVG